jgi:hypothetical protein
MIWTTWRQHRAEATVGAFIVAAISAAMIVVGSTARSRASALGLPACMRARGDCSAALESLHRDFHTIPPFTAALIAIPLLAGMFWAAPLVSREYEAGTHRLAWTQSVSPLRWITVKIALIFGAVAAGALVLGLLATWALDPLTAAFGGRYNSSWYDVQGLVPVACILVALSIGVAASAIIRRTIPAMAVTLVVYAALRIPVHWIRWHFAPLATHTFTIPLRDVLRNPEGSPQDLLPAVASTDWVHGNTVTDSAGHALPTSNGNLSILQHYCPNLQEIRTPGAGSGTVTGGAPPISLQNVDACRATVKNLSIREKLTYQPASHFWFMQTVESALFLVVVGLLVAATLYAVTRRRPT